MKHPFTTLKPEYTQLLGLVYTLPARAAAVEATVARLLGYQAAGRYAEVSKATGVPEAWMAASFEREASSNFALSPAQGDPIARVSTHVPKGRGPFSSWAAAAKDAYSLNGLDKVGAENWTPELMCFYGETFNGFGPRDHGKHTGYLWGASNIYDGGKYVADHVWDPNYRDQQLGIVPMIAGMILARPSLRVGTGWPAPRPTSVPTVPPVVPPAGPAPEGLTGGAAIQRALNVRGYGPLVEDGSIGRMTMDAVRRFQRNNGLEADGLVGPKTRAKLMGVA